MFILISILIFGLLIALHELGHFFAAKAFGVGVPEFAIGMGPKLLKKQGRETLYTLRALPIGGFCAMDGDDNDTAGDKSLFAKPLWQRLIIFVSGSAMNLVAGFLILLILHGTMAALPTSRISDLAEGFPLEGEQGFLVGDSVYRIDNMRVYQGTNIGMLLDIALASGDTVDVVVLRDGERVALRNLPLERRVFDEADGPRFGFYFGRNLAPTALDRIAFTWDVTRDILRQLPLTIRMFTARQAGIDDVRSVVGIVDLMNQAGTEAETTYLAVMQLTMLAAIISISVAVMNLLPIPGLDGGRIFLMLVTAGAQKLFKRQIDPKYEAYINTAGLLLLFGSMIFFVLNDIIRIVNRG